MREEEANANTSSGTKFLAKLSISKILNNIGCVQFESGNTPEAERTFEEALGVQQKIMGKAKPRTRPGFLAMASTMCNLGKYIRHPVIIYILGYLCIHFCIVSYRFTTCLFIYKC
jgi:hypothetical protein